MNYKSFVKAVGAIDDDVLDKYFEKRYELTQKRASAKKNERAPARNVVSRRLLIAAAAASLIFSLAVLPLAFDLAKDNANEKNNVTIPTEPAAPTTALPGNAALTAPEITEPETTAKPQKIVYKEGEIYLTINTRNSSAWFIRPGRICWASAEDREAVENEEDGDTLFYVCIDAYYGRYDISNVFHINDFDSHAELRKAQADYYASLKKNQKYTLPAQFKELGLSFEYQSVEYYSGYIKKCDIEKLKKMPIGIYIYLMPQDFDWESFNYRVNEYGSGRND